MNPRSAVSLLAVLVACGDDGARELPDAPATDGDIDAPPGGSVTVTAWTGNATRDPDAIVLFQSASGALMSRTTANASGMATGEVPAGGMVTVVQDNTITTIAQVGGGDSIAVGNNVMGTPGTATIALPAAPGGTTNHQVLAPCGSGTAAGTTLSFALFTQCPQPVTVVAVARAGATQQAFLVESATIAAGSTTTLTGPWVSPVQFSATIENLPSSVTRALAAAGSRIGTTTTYRLPTDLPAPSGGTTTGTIAVPAAFGDGTDLQYFLGQGFEAYQQGYESVAGARTTHTFDGSHLLPWIGTITETNNGVAWTQSSGDSYDGAIATFSFNYKSATLLTWRVILPESARQFTRPTLPSDIELPAEAQEIETHIELVESSAFDYAIMRATGGATSFRRDDSMPAIRTLRSSSL
jgi:hypothetical protein